MCIIAWIILFKTLISIETIESIDEWAFRKLPQNVNWTSVSSTEYVIQRQNVSFLKCVSLCSQNSNCNSVFLHLETCYGSTFLTPDSTKNSGILVYSKRPKNVCDDEDFVYYNGLCLFISKSRKNWTDAKSYCEVKGGNLLVLDSVEKNQDTVDFLKNYYPSTSISQYFVGASDIEIEGYWKWVTANAKNYFKFLPNHPDNKAFNFDRTQQISANCGSLFFRSGGLKDVICHQTKLFICEM